MQKYKLINIVSIFIYALLITSCTKPIVRVQVDGLSPNEVSTIKTENKWISIVSIDNIDHVSFLNEMLSSGRRAGEAVLRPGKHQLNIIYDNNFIKSQFVYDIEIEPGQTYLIKHKTIERSAYLWFENTSTGKQIGKVAASSNEALTEKNNIIDSSVYFTMKTPRDEKWVIAYRNKDQVAFAKNAVNTDETYGISINPFQLPNIASSKEFLDFTKSRRIKNNPPPRFNLIKDNQEAFTGKKDYCESFQYVAEDTQAVKKSGNKQTMILDVAGYTCRHPNNKNIGIQFAYSKRHYPGNSDKDIKEKANELFKLLTF